MRRTKGKVMDASAIERTLTRLAHEILERNRGAESLVIVGIKTRGEFLANPLRENVPLNVLGFGIYRLTPHFLKKETKAKEIVLVPQDGEFEAEVNGKRFSGKRSGGPFALGPGRSNASALYVPSNSKLQIRGKGEMAFFEAPALKDKSPYYLSDQEVKVVSRGDWIWRRDVVTLISPKDASSNLVVGETWSPPGFWSGTPLHQHDKDQPSAGESDHEEVYYHRLNWRKGEKDQFGSYAVQLLMDGKNLMKAYLIGEKSRRAGTTVRRCESCGALTTPRPGSIRVNRAVGSRQR